MYLLHCADFNAAWTRGGHLLKSKYVGPPYCRAEMYAGLSMCRRYRQTDGRQTVTLRFPLDAASVMVLFRLFLGMTFILEEWYPALAGMLSFVVAITHAGCVAAGVGYCVQSHLSVCLSVKETV